MTITNMQAPQFDSLSRIIGREIRAEIARQGLSQREVARRVHVEHTWVSRRVAVKADVDLTVEDIARIAEALGVSAERFGVTLPRLDSNQEPSVYQESQVIADGAVIAVDFIARRRVA